MKKQLMRIAHSSMFSKFFKSAAVVLVLAGSYTATQAASAPYAIVGNGTGLGKTVINHLSGNSESLLFQVAVENASGERFTIVVRDANNNTLYRGSFSGKDFNKKFRVPTAETNKLTFTVKSESDNKTETFEINSNTRVIEEVVVTRVG